MAIYNLVTLAKTSVDNYDFIQADNSVSAKTQKLTLASLFPSLATTGSGGQDLFISVTNKNQLNFKGLKAADATKLSVTTNTNNLLLTLVEAGIDLNNCNNLTAGFLKALDFNSTTVGVNLPVNGGTGLSTINKGAMLYASADDVISSTTVPTNGQVLIGNATNGYPAWAGLTAGTNMTITNTAGAISLAAGLATLTSDLNVASYDVNLNYAGGASWISGNGSKEGLTVNADGKVFVGEDTPTAVFAEALNIKGNVRFTNNAAPTIKPTATTGTDVGMSVTLESGSSASGAAGNLNLTAGTASGNAAGGVVNITAGRDTAGTTDGYVCLKTYTGGTATAGLTVASEGQNVTVNTGNLVITGVDKGIIHTGSGVVTQSTDYTTAVTINATSGKITLAGASLAASTNAEFTVTNSTVQSDSTILITVQDENTTNNVQLSAAIHTVANGSFKISIVNPHSAGASSATASKIHFLVINNS